MPYGSHLNFGVHAQDARVAAPLAPVAQSTGSPQTVQQTQHAQMVYMQPQSSMPMPMMMQPGHMPMMMQAQPHPMQGVMMVPQPVPQQAQTLQHHGGGSAANSPGQVVSGPVQMTSVAAAPPQGIGFCDSPDSAGASTSATEAVSGSAAAAAGAALPSVGSALHDGTGRCSPCAWFWKPRGCQSGATCGYCHMCPEGELKNRKRAKVQAIRMGAIEPANQARASLKLTTLL